MPKTKKRSSKAKAAKVKVKKKASASASARPSKSKLKSKLKSKSLSKASSKAKVKAKSKSSSKAKSPTKSPAKSKAKGKVLGKSGSKAKVRPKSKASSEGSSKGMGRSASSSSSREERKGREASPAKRKLGLRGAAPWAARHAAKHAAEARARAAEPAPPGSARATIRVPTGAEEIKAKISELHNQTQKIRTLRKRLDKGFFEIGQVLAEIQQQELYQAKGYGSFETFVERETDLGKQTALKMIKISQVFQHDAAMDYGMDRLIMALSALDGDTIVAKPSAPSSQGMKPPPLPLKPPMRTVI